MNICFRIFLAHRDYSSQTTSHIIYEGSEINRAKAVASPLSPFPHLLEVIVSSIAPVKMGLLWSSTPASEPSELPSERKDPPEPLPPAAARQTPFTSTKTAVSKGALSKTQEPAHDRFADAELQPFLKDIESASRPRHYAPSSNNGFYSDSSHNSADNSAPLPLTSVHTLPSTLSCRTIFDNAIHCQSPGGQWLSVYRHGSLEDCSEQWWDFWWCMRTNRGSMSEQERAERIRKRWGSKERALRKGDNSEDIWEERKVLLQGAWQEQYPEEALKLRREAQRGDGRGAMKGLYGG